MAFPGSVGAIAAVVSDLDPRLAFMAAAGVAIGTYLFIRGFLMLRYKRMIQNTPASKIRSASMGLVELSGMAEGPQTIPAGITGEACFYYRALAWQLKESGRNRQWKKVADESLYVPFFINDLSGRMLVDAAGADMELAKNFHDEFSSSFFGSRDMLPENVSKFLARNGVLGGEKVRLEERCVKPGYPLFVFGTLASRPSAGTVGWAVKPHVCGPSVGLDMHMNASVTRMLERIPGLQMDSAGISGNALAAAAIENRAANSGGVPATRTTPAATWSSVSIDEVEMSHGGANARAAGAVVAEPPVERVSAPVGDGDASPSANVGSFSAAICKGEGRAPFMISSESQREVVRSLGWKCALCIWGGPILTLISAYCLLVYFRA